MWKKFVHGLLFGAGFATGAALLWTVWIVWIWPSMFGSPAPSEDATTNVTNQVPPIVEHQHFLGSGGRYAGDFRMHETTTLLGGEATIQGDIFAEGKPAKGLRIRLALNGSVLSQWAEVDEHGRYRISVPAGSYRVDGFELDSGTANRVLANLIDSPNDHFDQPEFNIGVGGTGEVEPLHYVKPVIVDAPMGELSVTSNTVVRWQSYPGAVKYRVQIEEARNPKNFSNRKALFSWADRPVTNTTEFQLGEHAARLQSGKQYTIHIQALADNEQVISESAIKFGKHHFKTL